MTSLLRAWFGLRVPVSRLAYISGGVLFMFLKFAMERALFARLGHVLTPIAFLTPFFRDRAELLGQDPNNAWVTYPIPENDMLLVLAVAIPFLWIGISMSVRRALDAGLPPTIGFLFAIPGVHYLLILALCIAPTKAPALKAPATSAYRPAPPQIALAPQAPRKALRVARAALLSTSVGLVIVALCPHAIHSLQYGSVSWPYSSEAFNEALYVGTPLVMGLVAGISYRYAIAENPASTGSVAAMGCVSLGMLSVCGAFLVFERNGLFFAVFAAVPVFIIAVLGALTAIGIGHALPENVKRTENDNFR